MALDLPDFPWDELEPFRVRAREHPGGLIDLSVGSPVDPTPQILQQELAAAANSPGYPTVRGSLAVREALVAWWRETRGASTLDTDGVFPTVGSKEMVGLLPLLLGLGPQDVIVHPHIAYPTYRVGAALVGADTVAEDDPAAWPENTKLVWLNSPSNPTGEVLSEAELRARVARAREIGAVLVNDECYALLGSESEPMAPSLLSDAVTGGDITGLLALYSLSKQSDLAGYRAAMIAGDTELIDQIVLPRRHLGLMAPEPIQRVLAVAVGQPELTSEVRGRYQRRRAILQPALEQWGFVVTGGDSGLYIWGHRPESGHEVVADFAERGLLVAPGHFYADQARGYCRIALTAHDVDIETAASRLR